VLKQSTSAGRFAMMPSLKAQCELETACCRSPMYAFFYCSVRLQRCSAARVEHSTEKRFRRSRSDKPTPDYPSRRRPNTVTFGSAGNVHLGDQLGSGRHRPSTRHSGHNSDSLRPSLSRTHILGEPRIPRWDVFPNVPSRAKPHKLLPAA